MAESKIIDLYASDKQIDQIGRMSALSTVISEGSIFLYNNIIRGDANDAVFDIQTNQKAINIAFKLIDAAIGNTKQESIEQLQSEFGKDIDQLRIDITMYITDGSLPNGNNKGYNNYIREVGMRILDSYKGEQKIERKSKAHPHKRNNP